MNLEANEIQTIITSVEDVDEVQIITTSAIPLAEVQSITVSPIPGEVSLDAMMTYSLKLDTASSGGFVEYSSQISATADAEGTSDSIRNILGAMKTFTKPPTVTKSSSNPDGGHTYLVTFPVSMKDVPQLKVYLSDMPISISTVEDANLLRGNLRAGYANEMTSPIRADANEEEMQSAIESLNSIGRVRVSRSHSDDQDGYSWTIQFLSEMNGGNIDNLKLYSEGLTTTNAVGGAKVLIDEGGIDGSFIDGNFTVSFGMTNITLFFELVLIVKHTNIHHVFSILE